MTVIYGCGKFSEDAWTELVTAEGGNHGPAAHALERHMEGCPDCRAEYAGLTRMGFELRRSLGDAPQAKEAWVARVMADAAAARRTAGSRTAGSRATGSRASGRTASHRSAKSPSGPSGDSPSASRSGSRSGSRIDLLVFRPATLAFASALVILFIAFSGVLPWRGGQEIPTRSTGYTAPGGRILSLAERTEMLAAALTTQGVAAAAAEAEAGPLAPAAPSRTVSNARPIRTSLGIAAAVAQVEQS